jgi:phenylpyruvate tautomerase PptA (4-oxalocrotonate tautomerase family)
MPYLHLDLPLSVRAADRARIAARLARLYAEVMETEAWRVTVAFRELGENGVVRLGGEDTVEPVLMVQCDIRRGRPAEQRERLGAGIAAVVDDELRWPTSHTIVEFTQHAGDEFWRADGLSRDWAPDEGQG